MANAVLTRHVEQTLLNGESSLIAQQTILMSAYKSEMNYYSDGWFC